MCTDVRGESTLGNGAVRVWGSVCVDGLGAVVFLVGLAVSACQIGTDLCTDADCGGVSGSVFLVLDITMSLPLSPTLTVVTSFPTLTARPMTS